MRAPTASEQIYRRMLDAASEEERAELEGELVAICIAACRHKHYFPPREHDTEAEYECGQRRWVGGPFSLPSWVRGWVRDEVSGERLEDDARYIGRRCVNALIDNIRWHQRRKRGAQIRNRGTWGEGSPEDLEYQQWAMSQILAKVGLPDRLHIAGDRNLLKCLMAAYPAKLSNSTIAREMGVTEGAIRKRRRRISETCFALADGGYQLKSVFLRLGLKEGVRKYSYANNGEGYEKTRLYG